MATQKLKKDSFRRVRGGHSRVLLISCQKCGAKISRYQKDGPGTLRRMYLDRIIDPVVSIRGKTLLCPQEDVLGVKIIYEKEKRPAFRLFVDAVQKKIVKA